MKSIKAIILMMLSFGSWMYFAKNGQFVSFISMLVITTLCIIAIIQTVTESIKKDGILARRFLRLGSILLITGVVMFGIAFAIFLNHNLDFPYQYSLHYNISIHQYQFIMFISRLIGCLIFMVITIGMILILNGLKTQESDLLFKRRAGTHDILKNP